MLKTKQQIIEWLDNHFIEEYIINKDLTVDVDMNVMLMHYKLKEIPIQFGTINGSFVCNNNSLTSLKGSPYHINGSFIFNCNDIDSFQYAPKFVRDEFSCQHNPIKNLDTFKTELLGPFYHAYTKNKTFPIDELRTYYLNEYDDYMFVQINKNDLKNILTKIHLNEELKNELLVQDINKKNKLKV